MPKKKYKKEEIGPSQNEKRPKVSFALMFPKDADVKFDTSGLKMGEKRRVYIDGKINHLSDDDFGRGFGMEVYGISFKGEKEGSVIEDLAKIRKKRKFMPVEEEEEE